MAPRRKSAFDRLAAALDRQIAETKDVKVALADLVAAAGEITNILGFIPALGCELEQYNNPPIPRDNILNLAKSVERARKVL